MTTKMAQAEISFSPNAKQKAALFFMRMTVLHPTEDIVMYADSCGIRLECADKTLELERE